MALKPELQAKITPDLNFCAFSENGEVNSLNPITKLLLVEAERLAQLDGENLKAESLAAGVNGFTAWSFSQYLPANVGTRGFRCFLAALFNTARPQLDNGGTAYATSSTYIKAICARVNKVYDRQTYHRYLSSPLHQAFFVTSKGKHLRAPNIHRLTDAGRRFATFFRHVITASLPDALVSQLVAFGLKFFVGLGGEVSTAKPDEQPFGSGQCAGTEPPQMSQAESANVTSKTPDSGANVTLKLRSVFKSQTQNTDTGSGGYKPAGGYIRELIRQIQTAVQKGHQRSQAAAELRRKAERLGHPRRPAQRDINAISQPDSTIPDGFRRAGEPDPVSIQSYTPPSVDPLTPSDWEMWEFYNMPGKSPADAIPGLRNRWIANGLTW